MALGCLAALFGIGLNSNASRRGVSDDESGMGDGEIHSGPGGYEGMGYSGGYAAEYRSEQASDDAEDEESWATFDEGDEA